MTDRAFDPRLTPARRDIAAAKLRGQIEAERFVEGRLAGVIPDILDLKAQPRADAGLSTQLLHGEIVTIYDESEGWAFVQAEADGYVGYVLADALGPPAAADHRVVVNRTFVYPAADMKRPALRALPLDARVTVVERVEAYLRVDGGFIYASHLAPLRQTADFVAVAEGLTGTPYLWGGKSAAGIDCSGLVQLAASLAGRALPRDTDMLETLSIWQDIPAGEPKRRGDLLFWPGHVGIMTDAERLLHANGHHMLVTRERAAEAEARIANAGTDLRSVKRHAW